MSRLALFSTVAACASPSPGPTHSTVGGEPAATAAVTRIADEIMEGWIATYPNQAAIAGLAGAPDDGRRR
jgi:hypothetical protein